MTKGKGNLDLQDCHCQISTSPIRSWHPLQNLNLTNIECLPLLQAPLATKGKGAKEQGRVVSTIWAPLTQYLIKKISGFSCYWPKQWQVRHVGQIQRSVTHPLLIRVTVKINCLSLFVESSLTIKYHIIISNQPMEVHHTTIKHETLQGIYRESNYCADTLAKMGCTYFPLIMFFLICIQTALVKFVLEMFNYCFQFVDVYSKKKKKVFKVKTSLYLLTRPPSQCN